jgi:hypothetical protein
MIYKGIWDDATEYVVGDLVLYNYNYYLAKATNTDSAPPSANWKQYSFIQSICYILATFMEIDSSRVYIYNQDFKIPPIEGLFIVLEEKGSRPFSNTNRFTAAEEEDSAKENLSLLTSKTFTIHIFSKNEEARLRHEEVIMALNSTLAQEQQEIFQYQLGFIPRSFLNLSELEGAGMLTRFSADIGVNVWRAKDRSVNYFDTFSEEIVIDQLEE